MRVLDDPELSEEELKKVKKIMEEDPRKSVRKMAHTILLVHKGYQGKEIAKILDITPATVTNTMKRWKKSRIQGLTKKRNKGATPKLTKEAINEMMGWLKEPPSNYNYQQTTWTCKMLADLLKRKLGIIISQERVRQVLHEQGLSYKQPTLQPPTASPQLKKKPKKN